MSEHKEFMGETHTKVSRKVRKVMMKYDVTQNVLYMEIIKI